MKDIRHGRPTRESGLVYKEIHLGLRKLLIHLGENPDREGLKDTPSRVLRAFLEMTIGYQQDPEQILRTRFSATYDEMVILKDVSFSSLCEHHLMPFTGVVHLGYLPSRKVVGLSKIARLVECYAKRLQIQEQMTQQIAKDLMQYLKPKGAGVVIEASHQCMSCRGVTKPGSKMITTSMLGAFRNDPRTRAEFQSMIGK